MSAFVAYLRISNAKSGGEGSLGIEAQQESVRRFVRTGDVVIETYIEVESGRNCERPQLAAALAACRRHGARLLIAKLDRLSRRVSFLSALMESDVKFVAADMPDADPFRLHIEAAIAEEEARKISARTKAALAAARARGVRLGGYRGVAPTREVGEKGNAVKADRARARALSLLPIVRALQAAGAHSLRAVATGLNGRSIAAPRGGLWQASQVAALLRHAGA